MGVLLLESAFRVVNQALEPLRLLSHLVVNILVPDDTNHDIIVLPEVVEELGVVLAQLFVCFSILDTLHAHFYVQFVEQVDRVLDLYVEVMVLLLALGELLEEFQDLVNQNQRHLLEFLVVLVLFNAL